MVDCGWIAYIRDLVFLALPQRGRMILPDSPIYNKEKDLLKRWPLASKVADLIKNYRTRDSIVIGIEGPWGAGKTSFINLVLGELKRSDPPIIVSFNPWNFSGQNELLTDFFASLSSAVKKETGQNILHSLKPYVSKLKMSINPSVSLFGFQLNLGEIWGTGEKSLQETREIIDAELKALPKKILIVLDDLDRLDKNETRLIMKLVKITANFSNTVFLLAYDRNRVASRLDDKGWSGEEYLKKIVQVSFTLPEPDRVGLNEILFNNLGESMVAVYGEFKLEGEDEKHWREIHHAGFGSLFKTVRDIKRYMDSLRLNWSIVSKDDVNKIDFLTIEAIRIFAPQFYSAVATNKSLFTGEEASLLRHIGKKDDDRKELYIGLLELAPKEIRSTIDTICQKLFPSVDFTHSLGSDWQQMWRNQLRICAEERFDFYFQLGIPQGAVSEAEMTYLFSSFTDLEQCSRAVIEIAASGRIRQLLLKILDRIESLDQQRGEILLVTLWNLETLIFDERKQVFDFDDTSTQTFRIGYRIFKHAIPKELRKNALIKLINSSKSLYHAARLLALFSEEAEKPETGEKALFAPQDLDDPKRLVVEKISKMAEDGELAGYKDFVALLYRWKDWAGEDVVRSYVAKLIQTEDGVVKFLKGYTGKVFSTAGNYKAIDRKAIVDFVSMDDLQAAVDKVDVALLDDEAKESIDIFKNPPKHGW